MVSSVPRNWASVSASASNFSRQGAFAERRVAERVAQDGEAAFVGADRAGQRGDAVGGAFGFGEGEAGLTQLLGRDLRFGHGVGRRGDARRGRRGGSRGSSGEEAFAGHLGRLRRSP